MNAFSLRIAFRYILSKKSTNAINVITFISIVGMMVVTAALVVLLSVFNGLFQLNQMLFNAFNPDLKVTPIEGKVFPVSEKQYLSINDIAGIEAVTKTLEENALLRYTTGSGKQREMIATVKGVDSHFGDVTQIDDNVIRGEYLIQDDKTNYAVIGGGLEHRLLVRVDDPFRPLTVYIPKRGKQGFSLNLSSVFQRKNFYPAGTFVIQNEFDFKYMFVDYDVMKELLDYSNEVSSLEIKLQEGADITKVKSELAGALGEGYKIQDDMEQNETLYKVLRMEKWAVFALLGLILIIASFNIIASLSMLVFEKKKDISILKAMGASQSYIRGIFMTEGVLITVIGCVSGLIIGLLLCYAQMTFGIISFPGASFVIQDYPVVFQFMDFPLIIFVVMTVGLLASWIAAARSTKEEHLILRE